MPGHVGDPVDAGFELQLAANPIRRRGWAWNTEQREDLGQIRTKKGQLKIGALVLKWILDGPLERQLGPAIGDFKIDWIRLVRLPQHQRGAADEIQAQLLTFKHA